MSAQWLPAELWHAIFAAYMAVSSLNFFDELSDREHRYLSTLPWIHSYALPLMHVCKEWKRLATPLLFEHICFQSTDSFSKFEALVTGETAESSAFPRFCVQSLYFHIPKETGPSDNLFKLVNIISRLPTLHTVIDVAYYLSEVGDLPHFVSARGRSLERLSVVVQDSSALSLLSQLPLLRELHVSLARSKKSHWSIKNTGVGMYLPNLRYLNLHLKSHDMADAIYTRQWLLPYLAQCSFPSLTRARIYLKWHPEADPDRCLQKFFNRHPSLTDVDVPVIVSDGDAKALGSFFPITSVTLYIRPEAEVLDALPPTVTSLTLTWLSLDHIEDTIQMLLAHKVASSRIRQVRLHKISGTRLDCHRFSWSKFLSLRAATEERERRVFDTLVSLSTKLRAREGHPILLLDRDDQTLDLPEPATSHN